MNKDSWEVLKKDLKKIPIQERLLYLREIIKNVKDKEVLNEIALELKKTQETLNNESFHEAQTTAVLVLEAVRNKEQGRSLEKEVEKTAIPENGEAGLRYNASQEIEKANIYGRQQERPYNTATRRKDSSVDMIREGEKRREESYRTTKSSLLGQESTKRRKDEDEEKYR